MQQNFTGLLPGATLGAALLSALGSLAPACAQPPYSGTIFNFPNSFTDADPTALASVTYVGRQQKSVYDRRPNGNISINSYAYTATFTDGAAAWTLWVNPEFTQDSATKLAEKYARNIGQMPHCTRAGLSGAVIHDGDNPWGGGNPLTIHHIQGLAYERQGIITETMIHEATHAAFDRIYYNATWSTAVQADGEYISTYARDNPTREDHSETFLCWLVARHKRDRISATDYNRITATVPNRLAWYDAMNFNLSPIVPVVSVVNRLVVSKTNLRKQVVSPYNLLIQANRDNRTFDAKGRQSPPSAKFFTGI
jgi:hypothetical protein